MHEHRDWVVVHVRVPRPLVRRLDHVSIDITDGAPDRAEALRQCLEAGLPFVEARMRNG